MDSIFSLLKPSELHRAFFPPFLSTPGHYVFDTTFLSNHNPQLDFHCRNPELGALNNTAFAWKEEIKTGEINCSLTGLVGKRQAGGVQSLPFPFSTVRLFVCLQLPLRPSLRLLLCRQLGFFNLLADGI